MLSIAMMKNRQRKMSNSDFVYYQKQAENNVEFLSIINS